MKVGSLQIRLPDGVLLDVAPGTTAGELLASRPSTDSGRVLAALFDGVPIDLSRPLDHSGSLAPLSFDLPKGREILQHSAAHLVAKSVTEVVPEALPIVGPPTDDGFYYDFDVRPLTAVDREEIERRMMDSVSERESYRREELSLEAAGELFRSNPHKLQYLKDIPLGEPVSVYHTGSFVDLCRGPHVPDTGWLEGTQLLGVSAIESGTGAERPTYQRVWGVGFPTRKELTQYLARRAEAEARDHRSIGLRQELFLFTEEAPGFPFFLPKGMVIVRELEHYVQECLFAEGYVEVRTPALFSQSVYERSGHWEHFRKDMFLSSIDDRVFGLKPMNCPGSMLIFGARSRSYRELPLRYAEFAPLHRLEASGTLHGLTRVREFVQDDAHLFVTEEQVEDELRRLLDWVRDTYTLFRFDWSYELSTRPESRMGEPEEWDRAEAHLETVLKASGVQFRLSPGEGGFYGPKIDIHIRDSLGRPWQTGTIQLDYQMPKRFALEYQGPDGQLHRPVVIHRTILGTWERFLGVFIEHCGGRFPPWLAPVQARVLPVAERHMTTARAIADEIRSNGLRSEVAESQDTLSKRIRQAELDRVPYVLVVGDQEMNQGTVSVRVRGERAVAVRTRSEFLAYATEKVRRRSYDP